MLRPLEYASCLLAIGLQTACTGPAPSHPPSLAQTLDSLMAAHAEHFRTGNLDAVVAAYTDSAVVRAAGMEPIRGRDAMRPALTSWLSAAQITSLSYKTEDFMQFGNHAFHTTSYQAVLVPPGAPELRDHGSCALLWLWTAADGWKVHRSLCNSALPARPAPDSATHSQ